MGAISLPYFDDCAAILIQALIIAWLLYQHRRRHTAELLTRSAMAELQNVNKLAAAGELTASIANEVKQPLAAAAANAYAARNWLGTKLNVEEALAAINRDCPDLVSEAIVMVTEGASYGYREGAIGPASSWPRSEGRFQQGRSG